MEEPESVPGEPATLASSLGLRIRAQSPESLCLGDLHSPGKKTWYLGSLLATALETAEHLFNPLGNHQTFIPERSPVKSPIQF